MCSKKNKVDGTTNMTHTGRLHLPTKILHRSNGSDMTTPSVLPAKYEGIEIMYLILTSHALIGLVP